MRWLLGCLVIAVGCSSSTRPRDEEAAPRTAPVPVAGAVITDVAPTAVIAASPIAPVAAPAVVIVDAPAVVIVDAPMKWSTQRAELTLAYRRAHSDRDATDLVISPRVVVLHYTSGNSAKTTRSYFDNTRIEASRPELARAGAVNVSSHYLVDRDGTIYRLQPETQFARHCIGLNHLAIGIENVGDATRWPLTDAQVTANAALVRELAARFEITHLLGHHEVMQFRTHPYFVERDAAYSNDKPDPGAAFMQRVRAELAALKLSGPAS